MDTIQQLESRRNGILEGMRSIRSMRRGTITEQYFRTRLKGKRGMVHQGPYYVLSKREGNRTVSRRLRSAELEEAQKDIAEYKRFLGLCQEFERLTARLGDLERGGPGLEQEKKRFRSPSNETER